jgi:hypothetical protein
MNDDSKKYSFLIKLFIFLYLTVPRVMAQQLPDGWWQHDSAENILAKAESITHDLSFFQGTKAHLINNGSASRNFIQRKIPDGTIETKFVFQKSGRIVTTYKIESGIYDYVSGRLIKSAFERDQIEPSQAAKHDHPYDYKFIPQKIVGTNDCIVVARITTPEFLQILKAAFYPGFTPTNADSLLGDPVNYIRTETDTYIRKNDGVIIGEVEKNKSGDVLYDELYDTVSVNNPIPAEEFNLPNTPVITATNEFQLLHFIASGNLGGDLPSSRDIKLIRLAIIGIMVVTFGLFLYFLRFHHSRPNIISGSSGDKRKEK